MTEKEAMNLKKTREGYTEGFRRKKKNRREKCNYNLKNKSNEKFRKIFKFSCQLTMFLGPS